MNAQTDLHFGWAHVSAGMFCDFVPQVFMGNFLFKDVYLGTKPYLVL